MVSFRFAILFKHLGFQPGHCLYTLTGDSSYIFVASVAVCAGAAVRAGADACERVGDGLVAAHIIARPHREVEPALGNGNFLGGQKD